jgi:hypothetical protein
MPTAKHPPTYAREQLYMASRAWGSGSLSTTEAGGLPKTVPTPLYTNAHKQRLISEQNAAEANDKQAGQDA